MALYSKFPALSMPERKGDAQTYGGCCMPLIAMSTKDLSSEKPSANEKRAPKDAFH
jgi:hypothetical protein